ncbi:hypothetical protein WN48_08932 [Eufriesea mexicana]|uniref:Uncharacterized protein n=1 Tax=Eufriesea mexicana TaxID=516756 RepID=A0A310SS89_9HYME|nr:hypothetical protein WN48_08932 [Eufriesea mexicana]
MILYFCYHFGSNTRGGNSGNGPSAWALCSVEHDHDYAIDPYTDRNSDKMGDGYAVSPSKEHQYFPDRHTFTDSPVDIESGRPGRNFVFEPGRRIESDSWGLERGLTVTDRDRTLVETEALEDCSELRAPGSSLSSVNKSNRMTAAETARSVDKSLSPSRLPVFV